jgi:hypothetical protein
MERELELHDRLRRVVPEVPELLLENCSKSSALARGEIMLKLRRSALIRLFKSEYYPVNLLPPREKLFEMLHKDPDELVPVVTPHQMQFISMLAEFVHKSPSTVINALQALFKEKRMHDFTSMCYSAIPAFYGFFSCWEHLQAALPFYCTLVGTGDTRLVQHVLIAFYCSGATFRFIEMVYDRFCVKFCCDLRLDSQKTQSAVLSEYVQPLLQALEWSIPLLPHSHQFLIRFMLIRGWTEENTLRFFLHQFAFPQMLRCLKAKGFANHFRQMKALFVSLGKRTQEFIPFLSRFGGHESFEVPPAFTAFSIPFSQLLLTTADVHAMMSSLMAIKAVPASLNQFMNNGYFSNIDFSPFWIRVYSRRPKPVEVCYNWKKVVFSLEVSQVEPHKDFERLWRQLKLTLESDPIGFLNGESMSPVDFERYKKIKEILGPRFEKFVSFAIRQSISDLESRAQLFEQYLVHEMSLQGLSSWGKIVDSFYCVMTIPMAQHMMQKYLSSSRRSVVNSADVVPIPEVKHMCILMSIRFYLNDVVSQSHLKRLHSIESRWKKHVIEIRGSINLPSAFSSSAEGGRTDLLNRRLWGAIYHLRAVGRVQFEWILIIILSAMEQLDELMSVHGDDTDSTVVEYAVAFCDAGSIISRFLLVNGLVVKRRVVHGIGRIDRFLELWSRLENAILKLLARDEELMCDFLQLQDEVMSYKFL